MRKLVRNVKFLLIFLLMHIGVEASSEYAFQGYFQNHDNARLVNVGYFLPFNPVIAMHACDSSAQQQCVERWPMAKFTNGFVCDFLWIDDEGNELKFLKSLPRNPKLKVIYTTTSFNKRDSHYLLLKRYLEMRGFVLFSHWYWKKKNGHAIFVKKEMFDVFMKGLNYTPHGKLSSVPVQAAVKLDHFFKKASNKTSYDQMEGIDYTYMISLDERPEKFSSTNNHLSRFGIYPYRFSAVNGWKLPFTTIKQVGVPLTEQMRRERLMGTTYKNVGGKIYTSNGYLDQIGETYMSMGLTHGAIGIVLSHLSVLQDAYDAGYETIWVMEDDVEVVGNPQQLPNLIKQLDALDNSWDILFTDPDTKDTMGNYVSCRCIAARPNFSIPPMSTFMKRFYPVGESLQRIGMRYGAYSMIIRRNGIKKILDHFKAYHIFLPYDMEFWLVPKIRMYCPKNGIISHKAGALTDNGRPAYKNANL